MQTVAVVGNIGAGKSTLLRRMEAIRPDWRFQVERIVSNPFLPLLSADAESWAFCSQLQFLMMRIEDSLSAPDRGVYMVERVAEEDLAVFCRVMLERGWLSASEHKLLTQTYSAVADRLLRPDVFVFLQANLSTLERRVLRRSRPGEEHVDLEELAALERAYQRWMESIPGTRKLVIDTEGCSPDSVAEECARRLASSGSRH